MTPCEHVQPALLDEVAPRPEGLEAHLASCAACQAVAAAHRSALRLRGVELARARHRPLAQVQRRAGLVAGLVLAVGGGLGWYQLEFGALAPVVEEPAAPLVTELALPALAVEPSAGELLALAQLQASISADLARDPREEAAAVLVFGALPRWTAPRRTQPMRSLGRAASPVVFTSEDSP